MSQRTTSRLGRYLLWCLLPIMLLAFGETASAQTLTNVDVVKMVQAQLSDFVIIAKIESSTCAFDTSPDALINLKRSNVSDAVLRAMTKAVAASSSSGLSRDSAALIPTALGYYVLDRNDMKTLATARVDTKVGIIAGASIGSNVGYAVDGFAGEPRLAVRTLTPIFIVYQQNLNTNDLHLAELVYVNTLKAYEFNILGTQPQFFRNVYGRDYNETIPIDLWRPKLDDPFSVEPVDGKSGMYRLIPKSPLKPGKYTLYQGDAIHKENMIFAAGANRQSEGIYFAVLGQPEAPPASRPSAVQPSTSSTTAPCSDYDSCGRAGQAALQSSDWAGAISDFQAAANQRPTNGEAWMWLGKSYLAAGREQDAPGAWDKALQLGAPLTLPVCHGRGMLRCESGYLYLGAKEISFSANGQKEFSETPSQVTLLGASNSPFRSRASFGLQVNGKNYTFDFFPFGVSCATGSFLHCPEDGVRQQLAMKDYVSRTIPKLASGALAQPPQSAPTSSASPPPTSSSSSPSPSSGGTTQQSVPQTGFKPPAGTLGDIGLGWLATNPDFNPNPIHLGVDFGRPYGTPIQSIADGEIVLVNPSVLSYGGVGQPGNPGKPGGAMIIKYRTDPGQTFYALYGHLENMKQSGPVKRGEQVATVGHYLQRDGRDTPHLHFGVYFGDQLPTGDSWPWRQYIARISDNPGWQDPIFVLKNMKPGTQ